MTNSDAQTTNTSHSAAWPTGRIVVGIDASPSSIEALERAKRIAELTGASVQAISAWEYPERFVPMGPPVGWTAVNEAKASIATSIEAVFGKEPPAWFTSEIREGLPTPVLLAASVGADLLVLGSRGHGGFAGLLLGSVSSACAEHATCPVLVVHSAAGGV